MTLEQIFYLSQSIASVAVVGSLIYLGLQVRSAERSQRAIMQQGRADRASNAALAIASPELARVFQSGVAGDKCHSIQSQNRDYGPEKTRRAYARRVAIVTPDQALGTWIGTTS